MVTPNAATPQPYSAPAGAPAAAVGYARQPLGLPAGSVRALLAFMVLGIIWALMLLPDVKGIPLYLFYLMFLILGHFFAAHGHSIAGPTTGPASPLHLPRGSLRLLIVLGFAAVLGYRYYVRRSFEGLFDLQSPISEQPYLPLVLVGAFFLGVFVSRVLFRSLPSAWLQDLQAWVALLATIGLVAEVIIQLVINPTLKEPLNLPSWQTILAAIICFYFGARS
jgi:hypothetical protein